MVQRLESVTKIIGLGLNPDLGCCRAAHLLVNLSFRGGEVWVLGETWRN